MSDAPPPPQPRRRRWGRLVLWCLAALLALPVLAVLAVLVLANTGPGRALIEREAKSLTGGMVAIDGLHGRFPDALRVAHLAISDARGPYLTIDDLVLDWRPLRLIGRVAHIDRLAAARIDFKRLPEPSASAKPAQPSGGFSLPVRVELAALHVARFDLGQPVAGAPAQLGINGSATLDSLEQGRADLTLERQDLPGHYHLQGHIDPASIVATLQASEPPHGLASTLAHLPDLGALSLDATLDGPRSAEALSLKFGAGDLQANAHGSIDLPGKRAAIDLAANAPAMAPAPDVKWQGIDLAAHVAGPFTKPEVAAHATVTGLEAGGAQIPDLKATANGNQGAVDLAATLTVARLPGPKPDLLASSPLAIQAHAQLDDPARPVRFTLTHALVQADGTAKTGGDLALAVHTVVPEIAPLAAIGAIDLHGRTEARATLAQHGGNTEATLDGTATIASGQAPVPALLGTTHFAAAVTLAGQDLMVRSAKVDGRAIHVAVSGTDRRQGLDLAWTLGLPDLSALSPQARGNLQGSGTVRGPQTGLAIDASLHGSAGGAGVPEGPVEAMLHATGVPGTPAATLSLKGQFDRSPVVAELAAETRPDGAIHAAIRRLAWRSAQATGDLSLPKGATLPLGTLDARVTRLADLQSVLHQPLAGNLALTLRTEAAGTAPVARIKLDGTGLALGANRVGHLALGGTVRDPASHPDLALQVTVDDLAAGTVTGNLRAQLRGPSDAIQVTASAALQGVAGAPAQASLAARVNTVGKQVRLQTLSADARDLPLRLAAPATIRFGDGLSMDRLRLALGDATLAIAGRVSPTLALTAQVRNVTPALARPFAPDLHAQGTLSADASLSGTPAAPTGTVRLQATGLRVSSGPGASLPPAAILATARLAGKSAALQARVDAGTRVHLAVDGTAPLEPTGALGLRATGAVDLTVLDPILEAGGRRVRGKAQLDASVAGSPTAPRLSGTLTLADGEVQDFAQGLHISAISARLAAAGDTLRVERFIGRAGSGTLGATGSVGILAPSLPVDLRLTARDATPLASDLLTATLDADLRVGGSARQGLQASGRVLLKRTEITVPDQLPPSVAVLNVRKPGTKPPPATEAAAPVTLDLTVDAPRAIFVRGHGLDSELGGTLHVTGSASRPAVAGSFDMRRGQFSLAGTTLDFSRGRVGFDGTGVTGKIDPTLDFEADSSAGGVTATLKVGGYADNPKITLSSVPSLPQDEVLSHLLFGQSTKTLSPFQIAEIAAALAELSGVGGGGGGPLASIRKGLGLDRLNVGGGTSGAGASVEAGRYVANGVYVGAKQNTTGGGTQAQLQIDLTRRLKLQTQLGTGGSLQGATPQNDPGSSVGLSYQFEY